jgi:hypothetical protein
MLGLVSDNLFLEENPAPGPASIAAALGDRGRLYAAILEAASGFQADWKHYGRKYGWKLKVHDGSKTLLELTLVPEGIRVSIAAREAEMQALRAGSEAGRPELAEAAHAKEGWGIRLTVADEAGCAKAAALIRAVAAFRLRG